MAENPTPDPSEELVFRRGKLRKRDDPAVDLFREALANLADVPRVKRLLVELARFYDPVLNGPTIDAGARRRIVDLLEAGDADEARRVLEECFTRYNRPARPAAGP